MSDPKYLNGAAIADGLKRVCAERDRLREVNGELLDALKNLANEGILERDFLKGENDKLLAIVRDWVSDHDDPGMTNLYDVALVERTRAAIARTEGK